jgi:DNA polymerase-3 subunit gamma/tau
MDGETILESVKQLDEFAPDYADVLQALLTNLHKIAIAQAVPASDTEESIKGLAELFSKEDIQLFYQIGLLGQKDLPLAPNPKVGFEMVLLRMLSFVPAKSAEVEHSATKSGLVKPTSPKKNTHVDKGLPAKTPKVTMPEKKTAENLSKKGPVLSAARQNAPIETSTEIKKKDKLSDRSGVETVIEVDAGRPSFDNVNWLDLVPMLGLDPITLQLANNAALVRLDESECELLLAKGHVLLNEKAEHRLQTALSNHFNKKLHLIFRQNEDYVATPNAIQDEKQAARQEKAEQSAMNNKTVNKIIELFDAKIIKGSIKPIDK